VLSGAGTAPALSSGGITEGFSEYAQRAKAA